MNASLSVQPNSDCSMSRKQQCRGRRTPFSERVCRLLIGRPGFVRRFSAACIPTLPGPICITMLRTSCVLLSRVGARAFSAAPEIKRVGIVGMGSMGHGIAEMAARGGFAVCAVDSQEAGLTKGVQAIEKSLRRMADKRVGKDWSKEEADKFVADTRALVSASTDLGSLAECDLVIEVRR